MFVRLDGFLSGLRRRLPFGFGFLAGEPHRERRSFALFAFHGDLSALNLRQFLHQREADADALILPAGGAIRLPEPVENMRQILLRNAHAGVFHQQDEFIALLLRAQIHPPSCRRELQGVEQQIEQNLFEFVAIRENRDQLWSNPGFESDPFVVGDLSRGAGQAFEEVGQLQRLALDLHVA